MAGKYWIKLYHEILHDRKMQRLRDRLWRRAIECFLMAGDLDEDGFLPPLGDMAWDLRLEPEILESELMELASVGILEQREGRWFVSKFAERQQTMSKAEYMRRLRKTRQDAGRDVNDTDPLPDSYHPVTTGNTELEIEIELEIDKESAPLVYAFCDKLGTPYPSLKDRWAMTNWLEPQATILSIVGGDVEQGRALVGATVDYMDEQGLSYKNLKSLVSTARTVWNKQQANGAGQDAWNLIEKAWKVGDGRVVMTDERAYATVEAMGGWLKFKEARPRDVPFLKREFMEAYNASRSA